MPQLIDAYFLIPERNVKRALNYFEKFDVLLKETTNEYSVPQFSNGIQQSFHNLPKLFGYLENKIDEAYIIYWTNGNVTSNIKRAIVQFTNDDGLIVGISHIGRTLMEKDFLEIYNRSFDYLNPLCSCATVEEPPPSNTVEFHDFCSNRPLCRSV